MKYAAKVHDKPLYGDDMYPTWHFQCPFCAEQNENRPGEIVRESGCDDANDLMGVMQFSCCGCRQHVFARVRYERDGVWFVEDVFTDFKEA